MAAYIKNYIQEHPEQLEADELEDDDEGGEEVENILTAAEGMFEKIIEKHSYACNKFIMFTYVKNSHLRRRYSKIALPLLSTCDFTSFL